MFSVRCYQKSLFSASKKSFDRKIEKFQSKNFAKTRKVFSTMRLKALKETFKHFSVLLQTMNEKYDFVASALE